MSSKSKKRSPQLTLNRAIKAALTMFLWAYCEVYDPSYEEMEAISKEIQSVQESIMTGRLKLSDVAQALEDERGWKIL